MGKVLDRPYGYCRPACGKACLLVTWGFWGACVAGKVAILQYAGGGHGGGNGGSRVEGLSA